MGPGDGSGSGIRHAHGQWQFHPWAGVCHSEPPSDPRRQEGAHSTGSSCRGGPQPAPQEVQVLLNGEEVGQQGGRAAGNHQHPGGGQGQSRSVLSHGWGHDFCQRIGLLLSTLQHIYVLHPELKSSCS